MKRRNSTDRTGRGLKPGRYVALSHWMMRTAAWRSLDTVARCAYVELAARYAGPGSNNGRLPFSLREMAGALNVSKMTARRAMQTLQDRGFIVEIKRGAFSLKERHATEWRLTEFGCDVTGALATKDFARWEETKHGIATEPERVSRRYRTGNVAIPPTPENSPYGIAREPVSAPDGIARGTPVSYQIGNVGVAGPRSSASPIAGGAIGARRERRK
jgi:DNA binding protein with HTH domain